MLCKKCLIPSTKSVCQACLNYANRKKINWKKRKEELRGLCKKYRRKGYYDCLIPVSGGKDSHFLIYVMKVEMGMNPLLMTISDPFTKTKAGVSNFKNLGDAFGCDHIVFNINTDLFRKVTKIGFEEFADPLRFLEAAIETVPYNMAIKLDIPFIVWGEDAAYEYGRQQWESDNTGSAMKGTQTAFKIGNVDFWLKKGISIKELNCIMPPKEWTVHPIYMSYFSPWSSTKHVEIARRYGFRDLSNDWKREGYVEDFEQIDSEAYMVHLWLKYPKFGYQRTTDIVSRRIREGLMTISEGREIIRKFDHKLDQRALDDFLKFLGYTSKEFWDIVERFWNPKIFKKVDGVWVKR